MERYSRLEGGGACKWSLSGTKNRPNGLFPSQVLSSRWFEGEFASVPPEPSGF